MMATSFSWFWRFAPLCVLTVSAIAPSCIAAEPSPDQIELEEDTRQRCLTILRNGMRSAEFWPSIHAAEGLTLGGHGAEVIAFLEPLLDGPYDDQQRCGLSRELVRAGKRESAKVMLDILAGEDTFGHVHAAESLYKVGELGDGRSMRKAFDQNKNARLKLMAAAALGKSGNSEALKHIRKVMFDPDPEQARTAAWIIARIGDPNDIDALNRGFAKMKDEISRAYFEHALATLGDPKGRKALARNLNSKDAAVRTYSATFAGDARVVSVAPRLIELLGDENIDVRVRSAQSLLVLAQPPADPSSLAVLPNAKESVYHALVTQAHSDLDKRRQEFEKLDSLESCQAWQKTRREFFIEQLGGLPPKTPLNPEVTGNLDGGEYRIEKVIYQSRPNHHVTATVYLPKTKGPYPAVLIACGHTKSGKAADYNQKIGILLAKNGMAAMCYDPIGQGERSQILTEEGHPEHRGSTTEHFLVGVGSILVGTNTAAYRIWDGIRGIDYLCQREDIHPEKIGCTGCSGGGTLTSYIMALDDRVYCAAPACYLTTLEKLIDTIGPQDAEQNIHAQIAFGMDQTDYVLMRAPKPTLICCTTDDFFHIDGTWDTFRQSKRFYAKFGQPEQVNLVESAGRHGVTKTGREAIVRWMQRWLLGIDKDITDAGSKTWSAEELQCTPKGQVLRLEGELSVFDLNERRAKKSEKSRNVFGRLPKDEAQEIVRQVSGIRKLEDIPPASIRTVGRISVKGHQVRKLAMEGDDGVSIPILRILPHQSNGKQVLFLSDQGILDVFENSSVRSALEKGTEIWAIELRGTGELRSRSASKQLGDWKAFYMAYLLGQSLVGKNTEDALTCVRIMQDHVGMKAQPTLLISNGNAGVIVRHLMAVEPKPFAKGRMAVGELESWSEVCRDPNPEGHLPYTIHNVLMHYDLSDLSQLSP